MSLYVYLNTRPLTCCDGCPTREEIYSNNITHNLGKMATEAGIYEYLWRPEEVGISTAQQLIEPLKKALSNLVENRGHFQQFNSPNGWGTYDNFLLFVEDYLNACIANPEASVIVDR